MISRRKSLHFFLHFLLALLRMIELSKDNKSRIVVGQLKTHKHFFVAFLEVVRGGFSCASQFLSIIFQLFFISAKFCVLLNYAKRFEAKNLSKFLVFSLHVTLVNP